jgi:L-iditol 2-dehydrogenase
MKTMMLTGIRKMEMRETPEPRVSGERDVLLRIAAVGICGSDIHYFTEGRIGSQVIDYPFAIGHECAATVARVGAKVTRVKAGDRVFVEPSLSCGRCDQCLGGRRHTCRNLRFLGCPGQASGCLSEFVVMPEANCFPLPQSISFEQAALVEPLSICCYAVKLAALRSDDRIAILGAGPIGLGVLIAAREAGIDRIYVTEPLAYRRALAKKLGAAVTFDPRGKDLDQQIFAHEQRQLDAVFECCGKQEALDDAIRLLKPGGKLMILGIPSADRVSFDMDLLRRKEICIQNVRRQNECVQTAIDLAPRITKQLDLLLTHRFVFEKTGDAFELVSGYKDGVIKATIRVGE